MTAPTPAQIELMKHAVGYDSRNPFYRNHFCASRGSADEGRWDALVERGLAVRVSTGEFSPDATYRVSPAGLEFLRTMPPQPTPDHWRPGDRIPGPDDIQPGSIVVWKHTPRGGYGYTVRVPGVVQEVGRGTLRLDLQLANGKTRSKIVQRSAVVLTERTP